MVSSLPVKVGWVIFFGLVLVAVGTDEHVSCEDADRIIAEDDMENLPLDEHPDTDDPSPSNSPEVFAVSLGGITLKATNTGLNINIPAVGLNTHIATLPQGFFVIIFAVLSCIIIAPCIAVLCALSHRP